MGQDITRNLRTHNTSFNTQQNNEYRTMFDIKEENECLIEDYSCAVRHRILLHGRLFVSEHYVCFYSNVFGKITKHKIPVLEIQHITKEYVLFFPNAIEMTLKNERKIFFASFMQRDDCYDLINALIPEAARSLDSMPRQWQIKEGGQEDVKAQSGSSVEKDREEFIQSLEESGMMPDGLTRAELAEQLDFAEHRPAVDISDQNVEMTQILTVTLPVSLRQYVNLFVRDHAPFSLVQYHTDREHKEMSVSCWIEDSSEFDDDDHSNINNANNTENSNNNNNNNNKDEKQSCHKFCRDFSVIVPLTGIPMAPPTTRVHSVQRYDVDYTNGTLKWETYTMTPDIPFGESMNVVDEWDIVEEKDATGSPSVRITMSVGNYFTKSYFSLNLLKGKIRSGTRERTKGEQEVWVSAARQFLVAHPRTVAEAMKESPSFLAARYRQPTDQSLPLEDDEEVKLNLQMSEILHLSDSDDSEVEAVYGQDEDETGPGAAGGAAGDQGAEFRPDNNDNDTSNGNTGNNKPGHNDDNNNLGGRSHSNNNDSNKNNNNRNSPKKKKKVDGVNVVHDEEVKIAGSPRRKKRANSPPTSPTLSSSSSSSSSSTRLPSVQATPTKVSSKPKSVTFGPPESFPPLSSSSSSSSSSSPSISSSASVSASPSTPKKKLTSILKKGKGDINITALPSMSPSSSSESISSLKASSTSLGQSSSSSASDPPARRSLSAMIAAGQQKKHTNQDNSKNSNNNKNSKTDNKDALLEHQTSGIGANRVIKKRKSVLKRTLSVMDGVLMGKLPRVSILPAAISITLLLWWSLTCDTMMQSAFSLLLTAPAFFILAPSNMVKRVAEILYDQLPKSKRTSTLLRQRMIKRSERMRTSQNKFSLQSEGENTYASPRCASSSLSSSSSSSFKSSSSSSSSSSFKSSSSSSSSSSKKKKKISSGKTAATRKKKQASACNW